MHRSELGQHGWRRLGLGLAVLATLGCRTTTPVRCVMRADLSYVCGGKVSQLRAARLLGCPRGALVCGPNASDYMPTVDTPQRQCGCKPPPRSPTD